MTYSLTISNTPRTATIRVTGDLDYETADNLVEVATNILEQNRLGELHIDFSQTEFLDSAALSGLLQVHRRTSAAGVELYLDHRPHFLDRVLQVTGLFGHFVPEEDAASDDPRLSPGNSGVG